MPGLGFFLFLELSATIFTCFCFFSLLWDSLFGRFPVPHSSSLFSLTWLLIDCTCVCLITQTCFTCLLLFKYTSPWLAFCGYVCPDLLHQPAFSCLLRYRLPAWDSCCLPTRPSYFPFHYSSNPPSAILFLALPHFPPQFAVWHLTADRIFCRDIL